MASPQPHAENSYTRSFEAEQSCAHGYPVYTSSGEVLLPAPMPSHNMVPGLHTGENYHMDYGPNYIPQPLYERAESTKHDAHAPEPQSAPPYLGKQLDPHKPDHGDNSEDGYDIIEQKGQHFQTEASQYAGSFSSHSSRYGTNTSVMQRLWLWEILSSVFSIAAVAAVAVVLLYEQGKPLDRWEKGLGRHVSPTAVVSFLGAIGKSACLVAITEILSQLKWIHFSTKSGKLSDLQLFDDASRGPLGSIQLIVLKNRTAILAVCASIVTLAALLVDPFLQLVFRFPSKLTPVDESYPSILSSTAYDPSHVGTRFGQCYGASEVDSIMQAAILAPAWHSAPAPSLPCNYQRCEWPTVTTIGACSRCEDVTHTVTSTCSLSSNFLLLSCNYTIPATNTTLGATFGVSGGAAELLQYNTVWQSVAVKPPLFVDLAPDPTTGDAEIISFTSIKFPPDVDWHSYITDGKLTTHPPVQQAMQCSMSLCAQTFENPYYANSTLAPLSGAAENLVVVDSVQGAISSDAPFNINMSTTGPTDSPGANTTFQINYCKLQDLVYYLSELFTVEYLSGGMTGVSNAYHPLTPSFTNPITPNIGLVLSQAADISVLLQSMAAGMTEVFRTSANSTAVNGVGMNNVTYINIKWGWFLLPAIVVGATFVMLVIMIFRNKASGVPTWKSSSLALLAHELEGYDKEHWRLATPQDAEKQTSGFSK